MSSQGSPTLDLDVRARRTERRIAVTATLAAVVAPLLLQIDWRLSAAAALVCAFTVGCGFWSAGWLPAVQPAGHRLCRLVWLADGRWLLTNERGDQFETSLLDDTRLGFGCAWLRWTTHLDQIAPGRTDRNGMRHRYAMLLGPGDLRASDLRRLQVRLAVDPFPAQVTPVIEDTEFRASGSRFRECRTAFALGPVARRACLWLRRTIVLSPFLSVSTDNARGRDRQ